MVSSGKVVYMIFVYDSQFFNAFNGFSLKEIVLKTVVSNVLMI